eukprot:gene16395-698_t
MAAAAEDFAPSFVHVGSLHLHSLPGNIGERCTELIARRNMLCSLPRALTCSALRRLTLSNNRLHELPAGLLVSLPRLARLHVDGNLLTSLPACLGRLGDLEVIDASRNLLTALPSELSRLRRLRELHLAGNALRAVPDGVGRLPSLRVLDLSTNNLDEPPFDGERLAGGAAQLQGDNIMCGIRQPSGEVYHLLEARLRFAEMRQKEEELASSVSSVATGASLLKLRRVVRKIIIASRWPQKAAQGSTRVLRQKSEMPPPTVQDAHG